MAKNNQEETKQEENKKEEEISCIRVTFLATTENATAVLSLGVFFLIHKMLEICPDKMQPFKIFTEEKKDMEETLKEIIAEQDDLIEGLYQILPQLSEAIQVHNM